MSIDTLTGEIYAEGMELHLTPEQEAHLQQIAEHEGKTPEDLILDTFLKMSSGDPRTDEILVERIRLADCGLFLEEEEVDRRVHTMLGA